MDKPLLWLLLALNLTQAQAPDISYATPNTFAVGEAITPLLPANTGGAVISGRLVSTIAGSGNAGSDDGNGTTASFNLPTVVALDSFGDIFVVDRMNNKIRKITANGDVTTFAGSGAFGSDDGPAGTATFTYPDGAVFDSHDNLFISDQSNHKIRKITPDGSVSTFAGTGVIGANDGAAQTATFYYPAGMAIDANDNIYVADFGNNKIRKIAPDGIVSTFAGTGNPGSSEGLADAAEFNGVTGVGVDSFGNVYAADYYNNKIRKINTAGEVTTVAGSVAIGSEDGIGANASFYYPAIVSVDSHDNLFVTDEENNKIRKIDTAGNVTTFAGTGVLGSADGLSGEAAFATPTGVVIAADDTVFVCDYGNNKIRKIREYGYSISPNLPDGLTLDTTTGIISGTPVSALDATDFTITATNPEGSGFFTINISVGTLGVPNFDSDAFKIYPNPATAVLKIAARQTISKIKITNLMGQTLVSETNLPSATAIDISALAKGSYLVTATFGEAAATVKFIKQ